MRKSKPSISRNILIRLNGNIDTIETQIQRKIDWLDDEYGIVKLTQTQIKQLPLNDGIVQMEEEQQLFPALESEIYSTEELLGVILSEKHLGLLEQLVKSQEAVVIVGKVLSRGNKGTVSTVNVIKAVNCLYHKAAKNQKDIKMHIPYTFSSQQVEKYSLYLSFIEKINNKSVKTVGTRQFPTAPESPLTAEDINLGRLCRESVLGSKLIIYYALYKKEFLKEDISIEQFCRDAEVAFTSYFYVLPNQREKFLQFYTTRIQTYWISVAYSPYTEASLEKANILSFHTNPTIPLTGTGIIVGIVDTGIDYLHPVFQYADGRTKILRIWDQTIWGNPPTDLYYGTEFTDVQINEALASQRAGRDPYIIVPSRDENGHGTYLAGVAAGSRMETPVGSFVGAAPDAQLAIVKLKEAFPYTKNLYNIQEVDVPIFMAIDVMDGIEYLYNLSEQLNQPIVILLGLGTNQGSHDRLTKYNPFLNRVGGEPGKVLVCCAGDEGNTQKHQRGIILETGQRARVELRVAEEERDFILEIWMQKGDKVSISLTSPGGETTGIIPARRLEIEEIQLLLESTKLLVMYDFVEFQTGDQRILISFNEPTQGIWVIELVGDSIVNGIFDVWLPRTDWILPETILLGASPSVTITDPGASDAFITVGAYDDVRNSLYSASSRGYSRLNQVKPDIVAPGVNILGPTPNGGFTSKTSTSAAAAIVAGASALLQEWGLKYGQAAFISTQQAKGYFALGARRNPQLKYPNTDWGYGILDFESIFNMLK